MDTDNSIKKKKSDKKKATSNVSDMSTDVECM